MVCLTILIFRLLEHGGGVGWDGICSFIANSHTGLVGLVDEMTIYTLFAHCLLYKEGMAASLSVYLVPFML